MPRAASAELPRRLTSKELDQIEEDREYASRSYMNFYRLAWHQVEPGRELIENWHICAVCDHLQALEDGDIEQLLITIPPRFGKSLLMSVIWQPAVWTRRPATRWVTMSYAKPLAIRDAMNSRRVIQSEWYQQRWGHVFELTGDMNAKSRFENNWTGQRLATAVGASLRGEGGDFLLVDDIHASQDADSLQRRDTVLEWWRGVVATRNPPGQRKRRIVMGQRIHEDDLLGYLIKQNESGDDDWVHLNLPMEFDTKKRCTTAIGFQDPRTQDGELLWPAGFPESSVRSLRKQLGTINYSAQFQQEPLPRGGTLLKKNWFEIVPELPKGEFVWCRGWDAAGSTLLESADPDFTATVKLGKHRASGVYYIVHARQERMTSFKVDEWILRVALEDGRQCRIFEDQEGGSGGKKTVEERSKMLDGFDYRWEKRSGSKILECQRVAAAAEAGRVKILAGPWNAELLERIEAFPIGHDDLIDALINAHDGLSGLSEVWQIQRELLI